MRRIFLLKSSIAAFTLAFAGVAKADFPKNNLHLKDSLSAQTGIDEAAFHQITDAIARYFAPVVTQHGATLVVEKNWEDSTVNAFASQTGDNWIISMFGGLARRPEVTADGYALVVCHEIGHHLAGYFFKGARWASAEGQSDYWATQVCAKKIWTLPALKRARARLASRVTRFQSQAPAVVIKSCAQSYADPAEQEFCARASMGGLSLANLLAALGGSPAPQFETPDSTVVPQTNVNHPRAQCRLDTYFSGTLCPMPGDLSLIPGKNLPEGQNSVAAEGLSASQSCYASVGQALGNRPFCWFKPQRY